MSQQRITAWGTELRAVHQKLRKALALARKAVDEGGAYDPSSELLLFCRGFCAALTGHHQSEDGALFPRVTQRRPDLAPVIAKLSQDHSMLDYLLTGLENALADGVAVEEAHRHLDGIEAVMETHFRFEEQQLVEVLEAIDDDVQASELLGPLA